jgi:plasmid replication initiation protein
MPKKKKSPKPIVISGNNYIEAFYQTDYLAKKMMIASSYLCRDVDWKPEGFEVVISSHELRELSGLSRNSLKHLEKAVDKLHRQVIRLKDPENNKNWKSFSYLPKGEYKDGKLTLLINSEMKPFIQDLQKNFTQYHIENVKPLKSGYSIRIFELLKMHAYRGRYRVTIDKIRKMFGLEDKYKTYGMFKKRVLESSKKEIKEHCDIYFEYRELKTGNKVTELEFEIFEQNKSFSNYEDVLAETITDVEFEESLPIRNELEKKLNDLGWNGDFEELISKISIEAIEHYYDTLKTELKKIDKTKINISQLHKYIDGSIKAQAQRFYDIYHAPLKVPDTEQKIEIGKYSSTAKELLKLGFIGDVESYIEKEGRGLVAEALESFKKEPPKNIKNKIGLLREKIKALKIKKEIEKIDIEEEKTYEKNFFLGKLEKYKRINTSFLEDYKRFINIPRNRNLGDQKVLQKYLGVPLSEIPMSILREFIEWRMN